MIRILLASGLALLSLLIANPSFAQEGGGPSMGGWYFSLAAKGGMGDAGSADGTSIKTRDMYAFGGELMFGKTFGRFLLGASAEYNLFKQKTKASEVSNTNMAGNQLNFSPVLGMGLGNFLFVLKPILYSNFTAEKKTSSGAESSLNSPKIGSFGFQLNYKWGPKTFIGLEYANVDYTKSDVGGTESTLKGDDIVTYSSMSLIFGYKF
jgi:hypothetical protein